MTVCNKMYTPKISEKVLKHLKGCKESFLTSKGALDIPKFMGSDLGLRDAEDFGLYAACCIYANVAGVTECAKLAKRICDLAQIREKEAAIEGSELNIAEARWYTGILYDSERYCTAEQDKAAYRLYHIVDTLSDGLVKRLEVFKMFQENEDFNKKLEELIA